MSDKTIGIKNVDILNHYPEFLSEEILEYQAICEAENPEFNLLISRLNTVLNNVLPTTADEDGIKRYEEWLGILTNPTLPLEERRATVLARLNETLPYTEIRLQKLLAAIAGWGHFTYKREGAFVRVVLDTTCVDKGQVVYDLLERVLPLNLYFEVVLNHVYETDILKFGIGIRETEIITTPIIETDERIARVYLQNGNAATEIIETPVVDTEERIVKVFIGSGSLNTEIIETRGE